MPVGSEARGDPLMFFEAETGGGMTGEPPLYGRGRWNLDLG